jgi:hypothetical protein
MRTRSLSVVVKYLTLIVVVANVPWSNRAAFANPPWQIFSIKKIEADPNKSYPVTEANGPWMIMLMTFRGEKAEQQARQLVYELRSHYRRNAYTQRQSYDFTHEVRGIGYKPDGTPKNMHYANNEKFEEVAVLVGDYRAIDDPDGQKDLAMFKQAEPECLKSNGGKDAGGTFAELRRISQQIVGGAPPKPAGPLANAFMTTNPVLPKDYFAPKAGIDKFVLSLNKGVEHSLLDCKGRYSVKVATFTGRVVIDQRKINEIEQGKESATHDKGHDVDPLHYAAAKAHALTEELRKKGFEAYEFHDRYSSIVTIGSFNSVGTPRPDGKTEINPQIHELMKTFGPDPNTMTKDGGINGLGQKSVLVTIEKEKKSVPLDVQPVPIEVPRRSIGSEYQQASFLH